MATIEAVMAGAEQATDEQGLALVRIVRSWKPIGLTVSIGGQGLPADWWLVELRLKTSDYTLGIAPDGSTSS